jgi:uncharacterized membrane protein (UPF0127 family)
MIASFMLTLALLAPPVGTPAVARTTHAVPVRKIVMRAPYATLTLEVASTDAQRDRGLMNRASLAPHTGMIFVFDTDALVAFWMKNTMIPLDMVFIGADGMVRSVAANVPVAPLGTRDDQISRREDKAKYVIELPAGEAVHDGIAAGVRLYVPFSAPK